MHFRCQRDRVASGHAGASNHKMFWQPFRPWISWKDSRDHRKTLERSISHQAPPRIAGERILVSVLALLFASGCAWERPRSQSPMAVHGMQATPATLTAVENAFQVGPRLWSGGEPVGDPSFATLASRGVRTLVSVDGARQIGRAHV